MESQLQNPEFRNNPENFRTWHLLHQIETDSNNALDMPCHSRLIGQ